MRRSPGGVPESGEDMAEDLLFHHALGLTPGIHAFADDLRAAGHTVHTPDLFRERTFDIKDQDGALENGLAPNSYPDVADASILFGATSR